MINRASASIAATVGIMAGLLGAQWWVVTPGVVTDTEFHVTLLAFGPALVLILSAHWINDGRRSR